MLTVATHKATNQWTSKNRGFRTSMVYLDYIICLRYTTLNWNSWNGLWMASGWRVVWGGWWAVRGAWGAGERCRLGVRFLTSQQQASVSLGRICSDKFTCCQTEIEVAEPTFHLTQSQYTDTGPTSPSGPQVPGRVATGVPILRSLAWFDPEKPQRKRGSNPGSSALEADTLTTMWSGLGERQSTWQGTQSAHKTKVVHCIFVLPKPKQLSCFDFTLAIALQSQANLTWPISSLDTSHNTRALCKLIYVACHTQLVY